MTPSVVSLQPLLVGVMLRNFRLRSLVKKRRNACDRIAAGYRGWVQRRSLRELHGAAATLQAAWRAFREWRAFAQLRETVSELQALWRMRRALNAVRDAEQGALQRAAVQVLQAWWRGQRVRLSQDSQERAMRLRVLKAFYGAECGSPTAVGARAARALDR